MAWLDADRVEIVDGDRLVVVEVALLLRQVVGGGQGVGQDHAGLFAHLAAVEAQGVVVQQERVLVLGAGEVPGRLVQEGVVLGMHAQDRIDRQPHGRRRPRPVGDLRLIHPQPGHERRGRLGIGQGDASHQLPGVLQVRLGHAVGVVVVVDQGGVFVWPGDAGDAEGAAAARTEAADLQPDARGLPHHLGPVFDQEGLVAGRPVVGLHREGDVGVDVVLGRAAGEIGRGLVAGDGPPGIERAAGVVHLAGVQAGAVQGGCAEHQLAAGPFGGGHRQHRHGEHLGVPEAVALVALAADALGGDADRPVAWGVLAQLEQVVTQGGLELGGLRRVDLGLVPEGGEVGGLDGGQGLEAAIGQGPR